MRLSFSTTGETLTATIEMGTLSFKQTLPYQEARLRALVQEVGDVLERGNRAHSLDASNLRNLRQAGQQLCGCLIHPEIASRLQVEETGPEDRTVYLQVDEQLIVVPWELLHDGAGFWCELYDMGRAVVTPQANVRPPTPIPSVGPLRLLVVCADPTGNLPQVYQEGEQLVDHLDSTSTIDAHLLVDPKVETVTRALRDHDMVHFAGHADHDFVHPQQSGWHLADGKLTAGSLVEMAGSRQMPLMVFSNACRSGQTERWSADEPERVHGMANAALLAGVRLYIGTQWDVVDSQSASLSLAFYEALSRGASAGSAMRVARRQLADGSQAALTWASYVLYGDPSLELIPAEEDENTLPPMLSTTTLKTRGATPWKRPTYAGKRLAVPEEPEENESPKDESEEPRTGRPSPTRKTLELPLLLLLLIAVAVASWAFFRPSQVEPCPTRTAASLERGPVTSPLPKVALLLANDPCLEQAIAQTGRFRLIPQLQVEQLSAADRIDLSSPQSAEKVLELARGLGAELALFAPKADRLAVIDILTGQLPKADFRAASDATCGQIATHLVRIFHGEGVVTSIKDGEIVVNLGWRSRVAPGTKLELYRDSKRVGQLVVRAVELDQCRGPGTAKLGDQARLPNL